MRLLPPPSLSSAPAPPVRSPRPGLTRRGPSTPHTDRKRAGVGAPFATTFDQYRQSQERTLEALSSRARFLQKTGDRGRAVGARSPPATRAFSFLTEMTATAARPRPRQRPALSRARRASRRPLCAGSAARGAGARGLPSARPPGRPRSVLNIHRDRYFLKGEPTARESSQPRGRTKEGLRSCVVPSLGRRSPAPLSTCSDGRFKGRTRGRDTSALSLFSEGVEGATDLAEERKLAPPPIPKYSFANSIARASYPLGSPGAFLIFKRGLIPLRLHQPWEQRESWPRVVGTHARSQCSNDSFV